MKLCAAVQEGCGYKDTRALRYFSPLAKYFTVCITYQAPLVYICAIRQRHESFSVPKSPQRFWHPPTLLFHGYRGSFQGIKRPGHDVYHLPHLTSRLRMSGAIPLFPYTLHGVHRANFVLLFVRFLFLTSSKLLKSDGSFEAL